MEIWAVVKRRSMRMEYLGFYDTEAYAYAACERFNLIMPQRKGVIPAEVALVLVKEEIFSVQPAPDYELSLTACGAITPYGPCDLSTGHPVGPWLPGFSGHLPHRK